MFGETKNHKAHWKCEVCSAWDIQTETMVSERDLRWRWRVMWSGWGTRNRVFRSTGLEVAPLLPRAVSCVRNPSSLLLSATPDASH